MGWFGGNTRIASVEESYDPLADQAEKDLAKQKNLRSQAAQMYAARQGDLSQQADQYSATRAAGGQALQQANDQGIQDIARQGAEARANAAAAGGGNTASVYGGLLAAGKAIGNQQATFRSKAAQDLANYNLESQQGVFERQNAAREAGLESLQAQQQMGTETENSQKAWADKLAELQGMEAESKKNWNIVGEQEALAQRYEDMAAATPDPYVKQQIMARAARIRSGEIDV